MKMKTLKALCLALTAVFLVVCLGACSNTSAPSGGSQQPAASPNVAGDKAVDSVEVSRLPDKTTYVIGDTFSAEGGILKVNYTDGTSAELSMTDSAVTLSDPKMNTANAKNVTATCGGKKAVFKVEVVGAMCDVTFNQNYDGAPAAETVQVSRGDTVEEPATPTRDGYAFAGWYANQDYTNSYDFASPVEDTTSVYALWTKDGASYVDVTFDYDFYGAMRNQYSYPVEVGTAVAKPSADPVRTGYTFTKWVSADGSDYDFSQPITAAATVKATWARAVDGVQTYVFEAEDTDLTGKIGPSYSGTAQEESMIIFNDTIGASNDRVVGYLYEKNNSLEFYIASDADVSDATIAVSITGEYVTMSYDSNDFQVLVNDSAKNYSKVSVEIASQEGYAQCEDRIVINNVSLKKGANLIQLKTNNTNAIDGTTFKANAPIVDCIKVTTSAVLAWDENFGVPALSNYQH